MNKLVSVIIPTYKRRYSTLKSAVNSVLNQSYNQIEILVVDDNSDSFYINDISRLEVDYPQVTILSYEGNRGACYARNYGIKNAKGEFIAFLDDDDSWKSDKIEKQIKVIEKDESIALVYCGISWFLEKENSYKNKPAVFRKNPSRELLIKNYIGSTSCGLVRRTAVVNIGLFDENLRSGQDLDLWIRLSLNYNIDYVEECLVNYTLYETDTISSNTLNRLYSNLYLRKKYNEIIKEDNELKTVYSLKILKAYLINRMIIDGIAFALKSLFNGELSLRYVKRYLG